MIFSERNGPGSLTTTEIYAVCLCIPATFRSIRLRFRVIILGKAKHLKCDRSSIKQSHYCKINISGIVKKW